MSTLAGMLIDAVQSNSRKLQRMSRSDKIRLRPALPDDDAPCGRIIRDATLASSLPHRLPHACKLWEDDSPLPTDGRARLVAEYAGDLVGFADYSPERAHIRYLFVAPAMQGRGIGAMLMASVQNELDAAISVHCLAVNDTALRWYLRHRFNVVAGFLEALEGQEVVWLRLVRDRLRDT